MLLRSASSVVGRLLTVAAAGVATVGLLNCTSISGGVRDGVLGDRLSPAGGPLLPRATLDEVLSGAAGTYIDRLLADRDSTLERWPSRPTDTLRVWVDSSSELTGVQTAFPNAVRAAFHEWSTTGIPLHFEFVSSARDADVHVRWTDHLAKKTGSTTWRTDRIGWLVSGDITLATHISNGQALDARGMRAIALHEVGHALGLSHSVDPRDIMAPLVRVDGLSLSDRSTIRLLYSLPAGRVD